MLDDVDDLRGDSFGDCFQLVRCPFELAVELTGGGENGQLADASSQSRFVSQIMMSGRVYRKSSGLYSRMPPGLLKPLIVSALGSTRLS
jgi:hypothetical protein